MNYFAIERNGQCWTNVLLADSNVNPTFDEFLDMNYDEMKSSASLNDFVAATMEAADRIVKEDDQTIVTLIGDDDVFIWSVIMGYEGDNIRYVLVDWKKDGKKYRYTP